MATPAIRAIRQHWPTAVLEILVSPWAAPALEGNPHLDAVLPLTYPLRLLSLLRTAHVLRRRHYDIGIGLDRSPLVNVLLHLSNIPVRVGIASGWRGLGLTVGVRPLPVEHETRLYLRVLSALGISDQGDAPEYIPNPTLVTALQHRLGPFGSPLIIVHPGGGMNPGARLLEKRWPPEAFVALLAKLHARFPTLDLCLIGSETDREAVAAIRARSSFPIRDVSTQLSLAEIAALCSQADLFIGNDSGISHLAAAVGTPTVTIFGPTDPRRYRPLGPHSLVCAPPGAESYWHDHDLRRQQSYCAALDIRRVSVEAVFEACMTLLNTRTRTVPA
ncbi:MAG: glycosyltransferase family 9 protein [Thermorudis peleae]|nr:glycosyltransferase family 9 protein [Thermorudis peleae]